MKKLLAIILTVALIIMSVPLGAFTFDVSAATDGYYTYAVLNSKAIITYVDTSISGDVTIPSTLGGYYPVTSIGDEAFFGCTNLTGITIPDSVTSIGAYAFGFCEITSITIPDSVTSIGSWAFSGCDSLTSVSIGDGVTSIGNDVFYECSSLTSVSLGDSVISIGSGAFCGCTNLTGITIPDSVTSIGDGAFNSCYSLISINVNSANKYYCDINGVLFNKDVTTLIQYPNGKTNMKYIIPDGVINIGNNAFENTDLTSVTIPNSVTRICDGAFYWCDSLSEVYYRGSEADKASITIGDYNSDLTDATWYYNSCIGSAEHTYDGENDSVCNVCDFEREIKVVTGDTNGDGKINGRDYGLLMQYLNDWKVEINISAADVNGDGKINGRDYGLLMQYIND